MEKKEITLRPYQEECVKLINEKEEGKYLIVMATGLGKTCVLTHINLHGKTMILSHRDELVRQPIKYYNIPVGVEKASEHAGDEEVISASVQTICKDKRLAPYAGKIDTLIVDEAHHATADSYQKVINTIKPKRLLGFTATPVRGDGRTLDDVFDQIIFQRDIKWAIKEGYLCGIQAKRVQANYDLSKVKKTAGDFNEGALSEAIAVSDGPQAAAEAYLTYVHNKGRHALIYTVTVALCHDIEDEIKAKLPKKEHGRIAVVLGSTPQEERDKILNKFQEGKITCIINCMVLTEGTDLPVADTIIMLRPTCNDTLYQQAVGRALRLYPGKDKALIIDVVAQNYRIKHMVTAPKLFGISPEDMDEKDEEELYESDDLLDFADDYEGRSVSRRSLRDAMTLSEEEFNIFTQEEVNRILKGEKEDIPDEFDGFIVKVMAEQNAKYIVDLDNGEAVFSEKDVLNNTKFSITIGDKEYSGEAKLKEAVSLMQSAIYAYCDPSLSFLWSRKRTSRWEDEPATEKQMYRIQRSGYKVGSRISKETASRIINLDQMIKDIKKEEKTEKEKLSIEDLKNELKCTGRLISSKNICFTINKSRYRSYSIPASAKQKRYLRVLIERAENSGLVFDPSIPESESAKIVSAEIDALKSIEDKRFSGIVLNGETFKEKLLNTKFKSGETSTEINFTGETNA